MRDIECALVERWRWSLREIDETEMESLLGFIGHYPSWKAQQGEPGDNTSRPLGPRRADANDLNWL